jgi:hypothetical protein
MFNAIFPVVQSNATNSAGVKEAELVLGMDDDKLSDEGGGGLHVPYTYEPDHAVVLVKDGMLGVS